jgi:stage V sporulation protein SpoVS
MDLPPHHELQPFTFADAGAEELVGALEPVGISSRGERSSGGASGGAGRRHGPGQHAARKPPSAESDDKPGADFWYRIMRGYNKTKVGSSTNPRDIAKQIAAQARAAVDAPILQCIGAPSTNQAIKAIAISRTYLEKSDQAGISAHPDIIVYPEFVKLESNDATQEAPLSALQMTLSKRSRRTSVDKEGRALKVSSSTAYNLGI